MSSIRTHGKLADLFVMRIKIVDPRLSLALGGVLEGFLHANFDCKTLARFVELIEPPGTPLGFSRIDLMRFATKLSGL